MNGPFVQSAGGAKYFVLYVDQESDFVVGYLMSKKSGQQDCYLHFRALMETRTGRKIKLFKSDGGGEFTSLDLLRTTLRMVPRRTSPLRTALRKMARSSESAGTLSHVPALACTLLVSQLICGEKS